MENKKLIFDDGLWNGYCPESWLKGKKVKMRLNSNDFFESEETKLQIALSTPGVIATILKFRGQGKFRTTIQYAHDEPRNEVLAPQTIDKYPFSENEIIQECDSLKSYIEKIP